MSAFCKQWPVVVAIFKPTTATLFFLCVKLFTSVTFVADVLGQYAASKLELAVVAEVVSQCLRPFVAA